MNSAGSLKLEEMHGEQLGILAYDYTNMERNATYTCCLVKLNWMKRISIYKPIVLILTGASLFIVVTDTVGISYYKSKPFV